MTYKKLLRSPFCLALIAIAFFSFGCAAQSIPANGNARKPYNVMMIIIDDVAANLQSADNNKCPVRTPNIERLASRGTWFTNAYNDAPVCCASRTAILTGVHATRSGVYYNTQPYKRSGTWIANTETIPGLFKSQGYLSASFGKLIHSGYQKDNIDDFTLGYYKMHGNKQDVRYNDGMLLDFIIPGSKSEIPGTTSQNWTWGILPDEWDRNDTSKIQEDTQEANRAIEFLSGQQEKPFFLACGFWRPHVRWTVPKRYYDLFPLDKIELPSGYKADDIEDLPKPGRWLAMHRGEHNEVVAGAMWKRSLQAYYASMAYVDEQIGRVMDALEKSPHKDNTIVIFLSDNGMHLGEKNHWLKYALWEQTCKVLFSISVPGYPTQVCSTPVSLIDIYPTLLALCDLKAPSHSLDGVNLTRLLQAKTADRGKPVLSTYGQGNHAIRDQHFRYIYYRNGDEELYDHRKDPFEWTNLAKNPAYRSVMEKLATFLPKENAPGIKEVVMDDRSRWEDEAFR